MHREAADVIGDDLDLTDVQPGADLQAQVAHGIADGRRAPHPACRRVERRHEAVTHRLDLATAIPFEQPPHRAVVVREHRLPARVTDLGRSGGRPDDVREQDRREHAMRLRRRTDAGQERLDLAHDGVQVTGPDHVVDARELDEHRAVDVLGEVASMLHAEPTCVGPVDDEGRHPDEPEDGSEVALVDEPDDGDGAARARGLALVTCPRLAEAGVSGEARREEIEHGAAPTARIRLHQCPLEGLE
jgi:hypothetical protein